MAMRLLMHALYRMDRAIRLRTRLPHAESAAYGTMITEPFTLTSALGPGSSEGMVHPRTASK